jgi:hypothetical protein
VQLLLENGSRSNNNANIVRDAMTLRKYFEVVD